MGIFDRIKAYFTGTSNLENPAPWLFESMGGSFSTSGGVSPQVAMQLAPYYACLKVVSEDISQLPLRIYKEKDGKREVIYTHPVKTLLTLDANYNTSGSDFLQAMVSWAMAYGNSYARIEIDTTGTPIALHPIHPSFITVNFDDETGYIYYTFNNGKTKDIFLSDEIFHLKNFGDSIQGYPVNFLSRNTLGFAKNLEKSGNDLFKSNCRPGGILEVPAGTPVEKRAELKQRWMEHHQNGNELAVIDQGMNYKDMGKMDYNSAQFIESRKYQLEDICRFMRVPPSKLYSMQGLSYNSLEEVQNDYVNSSLAPWCNRIEGEARKKLLKNVERQEVRIKFDYKGLLKGKHSERASYYNTMRNLGVLNGNEIRMLDELPAVDSPQMEEYWVPLSVLSGYNQKEEKEVK